MNTSSSDHRTAARETTIEAPAGQPVLTLRREFDATPENVFRAYTDPELFTRWVGPYSIDTRIEHWDARTGGSWRYTAWREGERVAGFFGSFHELRPHRRLVQTFGYDGDPDGVALETATFEPLPDGRTLLTAQSVWGSQRSRDLMVSSGMETGLREGYEKLDALLAERRPDAAEG